MPKKPSSSPAVVKARAYCARQERAQQEVRDKLYGWGEHRTQVEAIIAQLIGEGFLNEARFAEHFAVSKFRQKGWGRRKIEQALRLKQVSEPCIALGLKSIEDDEYKKALARAVVKRWERVKEDDAFIKRQKVLRYFIGRGYAVEQVEKALSNASIDR
ncbi:MAG: RecX family transcriptional regulator [Flavobacteriales bacterium]|nr:RecX family transcriptional regulator [Flavobacteriales bacterium]MBP6574346.1 RecX family transcriptional regulator [Flavobacteriales bacterium]